MIGALREACLMTGLNRQTGFRLDFLTLQTNLPAWFCRLFHLFDLSLCLLFLTFLQQKAEQVLSLQTLVPPLLFNAGDRLVHEVQRV